MFEAVATLPWAPERGCGPEIDAEPVDGAADECRPGGGAQDFEAEAHIAEPAACGKAAHPVGEVGLWAAMGDDWGRLGGAMGQQVGIRCIRGCRFEGGGDRVRLRQVMMGLEARECGEPVQAQVGQEQAVHV